MQPTSEGGCSKMTGNLKEKRLSSDQTESLFEFNQFFNRKTKSAINHSTEKPINFQSKLTPAEFQLLSSDFCCGCHSHLTLNSRARPKDFYFPFCIQCSSKIAFESEGKLTNVFELHAEFSGEKSRRK